MLFTFISKIILEKYIKSSLVKIQLGKLAKDKLKRLCKVEIKQAAKQKSINKIV